MKLFVVILFLFSFNAQAGEGKNFGEHQTRVMSNIDKRIGILQEFKSCVSGAKDKAGMKACRATKKSKMSAMKEAHKSMKANKKK